MSNSISGNIGADPFISGGTPNVTVVLSGAASASTMTDANGNFTFSGLSNGTYVVTPAPPPVVFPAFIGNIVISGGNVSTLEFATLGSVTGTVATLVAVAANPNFAGQPNLQSPVIYTGTILFAPNTVVFFNNTQVVQGSSTPTVGATVQFDFAEVFTAVNGVGLPINPKYIGDAVNIFVTS